MTVLINKSRVYKLTNNCIKLYSQFIVLEKVPYDKDAFQCKILCFMHQGKFHDALQMLKSSRIKKG